ncbi:hypothetical protein EVAR_63323_1 [Eumeta japonica]|uniref:Nucleic-acid-binding protein from transposon X-element n=1 Tax=Eumeta variegata TaxID=151549 RepID=A0A4C1YL92_EUMVA|nr:hypothetical protein EVAR_63323_1 [Eumeta japonica]
MSTTGLRSFVRQLTRHHDPLSAGSRRALRPLLHRDRRYCASPHSDFVHLTHDSAHSSRLKAFLTERGHFDLLRNFEVNCLFPASSEPPDAASDSDMEVKLNLPKELTKRSAASRPSEDSDFEWSEDSDEYSDFTPVHRRKTPCVKPETALFLAQETDGSSYFRIKSKKAKKTPATTTAAPANVTSLLSQASTIWRKTSQPSAASQLETGEKPKKAAVTAKSNERDKAAVLPHFLPSLGRVTQSRHLYSFGRRVGGLKVQTATTADFKKLQNLPLKGKYAFHTYSLKNERELWIVLRDVLKEFSVEKDQEDLLAQNLPIQFVRRISNQNQIKVELPHKLTIPGRCHNCQLHGHSSKNSFNQTSCVKCLGNHGTAQYTRNKDTDGRPVCVLWKGSHPANYLGFSRAHKQAPLPRKKTPPTAETATRRAPMLHFNTKLCSCNGGRPQRPACIHSKQLTTADNLKHLMSIISIIDTK